MAISFALGARGAPAGGGGRAPGKGAAAPAECRKNDECVLVTDGCCGCHEGGKQRAIPARAREAYERKRKSICKGTVCPALMSDDPSCLAAGAACKEGKCALD